MLLWGSIDLLFLALRGDGPGPGKGVGVNCATCCACWDEAEAEEVETGFIGAKFVVNAENGGGMEVGVVLIFDMAAW